MGKTRDMGSVGRRTVGVVTLILLLALGFASRSDAGGATGAKYPRTVNWGAAGTASTTTLGPTTTTVGPTTTTSTTTLPSASTTVPMPAAAGVPVEAQQMSGDWSPVVDPQATYGTAVVINSGALSVQTLSQPGAYLLNVRLRSDAARVALTMNGQQIDVADLYGGSWRTVTVPVYVNGTPTWGIQPLPGIGYTPQPVYVDWLSLDTTTPGYTTVGNKIIDPNGNAVIPRGVNRDSLEANPNGWHLSDNDFEAMRLWGASMVRLPLSQQFWLSTSCNYDPGYAARVDQMVQSITKRGMIALVDLHTTAAGQACGTPRLAMMADDYSVQFWTQVANRYKSNPLVAFDLFNEPHDITEAQWHDGGMIGSPAWHAVGMQQLYDTVRATGANNPVFIGGYSWAYRIDVALRRPVDGFAIVFSSHIYNPPGTGPLPPNIDSVIPPVAASYPVVFGEFGTNAGTGTYNANVIAYAESHGIGWAAWIWDQLPTQFALITDWVSYTPTAAGQPVRDALWKARGWTTWGQ